MNNIKALSFTNNSGETRYHIVDMETGEILDDAQGYGYRTVGKAFAAYNYKQTHDIKAEKEKKRKVKIWQSKHKAFCKEIEDEAFYAWKDREDFQITVPYLRKKLEEAGLELTEFTIKDLKYYW